MATHAPRTIGFAVRGPIARDDLPGLCERVCTLFGSTRPEVAVCDVEGVEPDAVTVDALARLQLAARRSGYEVTVTAAPDDVLELIELAGLCEVLGVEPLRQAEQREERLGIEEERELPDAAA
jgi:ABC-type transporter Mla MlaB component